MATSIPLSDYAPPERVPIAVIQRQHAKVRKTPVTAQLLNSVLNYVFILNQQRQIIFVSENFQELLRHKTLPDLLGLRPGEALGCVNAHCSPHGCGTTECCRECGALKAILDSLGGRKKQEEFRLTRMINCTVEASDFLVYAVPFIYRGETFSVFSVADISHQKRRRALERVFFHDVMNSAGSMEGLVGILKTTSPPDLRPDLELLHHELHHLLEEIHAQRDIVSAESHELTPHPATIHTDQFLHQICQVYRNHSLAKGIHICLTPPSAALSFVSDPTLLKRAIGNLLKNALEATGLGQTVTVGCESSGQQICFWVHNPAVMPPEVQRQIFVRSFSTKGEGRGLGTYSVRMLVEQYLQGMVHFVSAAPEGTTFRVHLPLALAPR